MNKQQCLSFFDLSSQSSLSLSYSLQDAHGYCSRTLWLVDVNSFASGGSCGRRLTFMMCSSILWVGVDVRMICQFPVQLSHIILCYCKLVRQQYSLLIACYLPVCSSCSLWRPKFLFIYFQTFYQSFHHRFLKNLYQYLFTEICNIASCYLKNFWMFYFKTLVMCPNYWAFCSLSHQFFTGIYRFSFWSRQLQKFHIFWFEISILTILLTCQTFLSNLLLFYSIANY